MVLLTILMFGAVSPAVTQQADGIWTIHQPIHAEAPDLERILADETICQSAYPLRKKDERPFEEMVDQARRTSPD